MSRHKPFGGLLTPARLAHARRRANELRRDFMLSGAPALANIWRNPEDAVYDAEPVRGVWRIGDRVLVTRECGSG